MSDLRLVLQCMKGEVTYHGQVDSDVILSKRGTHETIRDETEDGLMGDNLKQYEAGDTFQNDPEDTLTSAMMLLARAITRNAKNDGRIARRSFNAHEESDEGGNVQKETGNVQRTLQNSSSGNATIAGQKVTMLRIV
uniref:Uncharacterized protein n=1 Tax=Tanacetum cinerariifolium TaxID=118510 RepID=A0A6L2MMJ9_TANCI|nr:hypothetical protein [Tanacetum cinerariifolium]